MSDPLGDLVTGFAEGFVPAYSASAKATEARESSLVNQKVKDFLKKKTQNDKLKKEDAERISRAKRLAEQSGAPDGSWANFYYWDLDGFTPNQQIEMAQNANWSAIAPPAETEDSPVNPAAPVTANTPSTSGSDSAMPSDNMFKGMISPVASEFPVSSKFGNRKSPIKGASENHEGIDLATPEGTPIRAPLNGTIVRMGFQEGGAGNYVVLDHGNGVQTKYLHLASLPSDFEKGDTVEKGQVFGATGNTGISTGPHLDFRITKDGKAVNPEFVFNNQTTDTRPGDAPSLTVDQQTQSAIPGSETEEPSGLMSDDTGVKEVSWVERARQKADERSTNRAIQQLGIDEETYQSTLDGYNPTTNRPEITLAYSPKKKPEDVEDWRDLSKVRSSNYKAFAAEARVQGDEEQAKTIEALGESMTDGGEPKYKEYSTMNTSNAEGRRIAANVAGDMEAVKQITLFINNTTEDEIPKYQDHSTLTVSNARGRAIAAEQAGDIDSLETITKYLEENDDKFPDTISEGFIRAQFVEYATRAQSGNDGDVAAFETWKATELPILMKSLDLTETDSSPSNLTEAYQNYVDLKRNPDADPDKVEEAKIAYEDLLILEETKARADKVTDMVEFIRVNDDGSYETVQGSIDINNNFVDQTGEKLEGSGWRQLTDREDKELNSIGTTFRGTINKYNTASETAIGVIRLGGQITDLVLQNPRALTDTAGVLQQIVSLEREVNTVSSIVSDMVGDRTSENDYTDINQIQNRLREENVLGAGETLESLAATPMSEVLNLGTGARGLARARAILESKILLMAFRSGAAEGQSGQAMSNRDFDRLMKIIRASSDAQTFITGMQGYMRDRFDNLNDRYRSLDPDKVPELRIFKNRFGYNPLHGAGLAESPQSIMENPTDERLQRGFDVMNGNIQINNSNTSTTQTKLPLSEAVEMLRQNPSLRNFFIQTYGEDKLPEDMRGGQ